MNISAVIETASWKHKPDAILLAWLPGQEGGNAVVDILTGKSSPSGKLSMTFPESYFDCNTSGNFPFDYVGPKAIGNYPKIPRPERKNIHYVNYEEDIYVGYRFYNTYGKDVSYPFGYGLSYTDFKYSNISLNRDDKAYSISIDVTNTGKRAGKEIVQIYAVAPTCKVGKPLQELVAFGKTKELFPGETQTIILSFTDKELSRFDELQSAWILDAGNYQFQVATSSCSSYETIGLEIKNEKIVEKTNNVLQMRKGIR